jgi:MYXO-CTERM domain-containing protein
MKKPFTTVALAAAFVLAPATAALASVDTTPQPSDTTVEQSDDGDNNTGLWGLLGLLGLGGLAGLKRRNTVDQTTYERSHTTV